MNDFFLWGTYAFFEVIEGNKNYASYVNMKSATTIFNIAELNYNLKKEMSSKQADGYTKKYSSFLVNIEFDDIINASNLKTLNRKLSIPDCIGYVVANRIGAKFLTGDEGFRNMKNVEFVK